VARRRGPCLALRVPPRPPLTPEQRPPLGARAIQLTKGWVAWVEESDYEELARWIWSATGGPSRKSGPVYAVRRAPGGRRSTPTVWMHREIMSDTLPQGMFVDHREYRDLIRVVDNRRCNLRPATEQENARYSRKVKRGASIYKGVSQTGRKGQFWQARIRVEGRCKELGCYGTPERAALAYDEAAPRYFGDFAWTNFPRKMQA
jgi:hypothetical protein